MACMIERLSIDHAAPDAAQPPPPPRANLPSKDPQIVSKLTIWGWATGGAWLGDGGPARGESRCPWTGVAVAGRRGCAPRKLTATRFGNRQPPTSLHAT